MPFLTPFLGEGSPTKIDYGKKGTLILTSLLHMPPFGGEKKEVILILSLPGAECSTDKYVEPKVPMKLPRCAEEVQSFASTQVSRNAGLDW